MDPVKYIRQEIIDQIDRSVKVKSIVSDDQTPEGTLVFVTCNVKWAIPGQYITDKNDVKYLIVSVDREFKRITIRGTDISRRDIVFLKKPTFWSGTHMVVNNEWPASVQFDLREGIPLIWLMETLNEERYPEDHAQLLDLTPRILFLTEIDIVDSLNMQHREQAVEPMQELVNAFYNAVYRSFQVRTERGSFEKTISRHGNEDASGMIENILNANLGGVEIRPTLTIPKGVGCEC